MPHATTDSTPSTSHERAVAEVLEEVLWRTLHSATRSRGRLSTRNALGATTQGKFLCSIVNNPAACAAISIFIPAMPRLPRKKTILVASLDPQLGDVRKQVLEEAGYRVIPAKTVVQVRNACQRQRVALVMIGYSLPPAEKRRVRNEVRQHCKGVPVLLLYEAAEAELTQNRAEAELLQDAPHLHQSRTPRDFLRAVKQILGD